MNVRAKMRCDSVTTFATDERRSFVFSAVYDPTVPEDERYARYTPYAKLEMTVDNPAVPWKPGETYYLDFTLVEEAAPTA